MMTGGGKGVKGGVYVLLSVLGIIYAGRAKDFKDRERKHGDRGEFVPVLEVDDSLPNAKDIRRGLEEILITIVKDINPKLENIYAGIAEDNPNRDKYLKAAWEWLEQNIDRLRDQ